MVSPFLLHLPFSCYYDHINFFFFPFDEEDLVEREADSFHPQTVQTDESRIELAGMLIILFLS